MAGGEAALIGGEAGFEVAPSGNEFFMLHRESSAIPDRIDLIFNWTDDVRKQVEPGDRP